MEKKELFSIADPLVDLLQGDNSVFSKHLAHIDMVKVKRALDFIINNQNLSESQKLNLISNSWRVDYRDKPPMPKEFLTSKYIGSMADSLYPRVSQTFLEFLDESKPYRDAVLFPHIGFGKEISNNSKIFTPTGYKEIKDMKLNDLVSTPDGKTSKVIGVYPQGIKKLFKITFSDGRTVNAGLEHLWKASKSCNSKIWNKKEKKIDYVTPYRLWKICTTETIITDLKQNSKSRWCIPLTKPVFHNEKSHYLDSYLIGVLIGDGCMVNKSVAFTSIDQELIDECKIRLPEGYTLTNCNIQYSIIKNKENKTFLNKVKQEIAIIGLNVYSGQKFIPDEYLFDSIENRINLLQGLLDTDGSVDKRGKTVFYTSSRKLQENVALLVRGLGGIAHLREYHRKDKTSIDYSVGIQFPTNDFPLFKLTRKQKRIDDNFNRGRIRKGTEYLFIKSIEEIEEAEAVCIEIDHPDKLYLTENYIVTHNSSIAVLINLYLTVHVALMRNPKKTFGLSPATVLAFVLCSFNLKKAQEVLLDPFTNILDVSEFFCKVRTKEDMIKKEIQYQKESKVNQLYWTTASKNGVSALQFSNGINYKLISNPNALLGLSIVCGTMTELAFFREAGKSDTFIMKFFNNLKERINSRMKGNYFGRSILDSSPNDIESPVDYYCMYEAEHNPKNYVIKGSRWQWTPSEFDMEKTFPVFTGGSGKPPLLLESAEGYNPSEIIQVPYSMVGDKNAIYQLFKDNLVDALKNQAGIPSGNLDKLFYNYDKIEDCFVPTMKSIEYCLRADAKDNPTSLIWNQIKDTLFVKHGTTYRLYYKPNLPRVVHIDQSISGDMASIAVAHIERKYPRYDENNQPLPIDMRKDIIYVIDFIIPISPYGGRINLDAIRELIIDLVGKGNVPITNASFDRFQSESAIQFLDRYGIEMEHLSVDETLDPYMSLSSLIESGNVKSGRNIILKNNLKSLRITKRPISGTLKVDHTKGETVEPNGADYNWNTGLIGINAKDVSDSVCGAVELAKRYLSLEPQSLRELWRQDEVILSPEKLKIRTQSFMEEVGLLV